VRGAAWILHSTVPLGVGGGAEKAQDFSFQDLRPVTTVGTDLLVILMVPVNAQEPVLVSLKAQSTDVGSRSARGLHFLPAGL
jgi:hypothetical protein